MKHDEQRVSQRIHVELPIYIGKEESVTRDVSWSGIYFLTDHLFAEGGELNFCLDLAYALPGRPIKLGCQGEVVRVEPHGGKFGVAAKISNFQYIH